MRKLNLNCSMIAILSVITLQTIAQDAQDEAIKKVVLGETESYFKKDSAAWESAWLKDPKTSRTFTNIFSNYKVVSWDSIAPDNMKYFRSSPKPDSIELTTDKWEFRKEGKMAVVDYDQTLKYLSNVPPFDKAVSHEQRILIKKDGKWKIASQFTNDLTGLGPNGTELMLNGIGYTLMNDNKTDEAIKVLEINTKLYPNSFNVFDSLGEAYAKAGNKELAIQNYKKSLELYPNNTSGKKALEKLQ